MTEKVCLADIKRTQNRRSPLCPLWSKSKSQTANNGLCAKKFVFRAQNAHKTNDIAWRIMADFVAANALYIDHSR